MAWEDGNLDRTDFPGGPGARTLLLTAGGTVLIPDQRTKMLHARQRGQKLNSSQWLRIKISRR